MPPQAYVPKTVKSCKITMQYYIGLFTDNERELSQANYCRQPVDIEADLLSDIAENANVVSFPSFEISEAYYVRFAKIFRKINDQTSIKTIELYNPRPIISDSQVWINKSDLKLEIESWIKEDAIKQIELIIKGEESMPAAGQTISAKDLQVFFLPTIESTQVKSAPKKAKPEQKPTFPKVKAVTFSKPATIVWWKDGTKTVVKCGDKDTYDAEKGLAMAIAKKTYGNKYEYYDVFKKWLPKSEQSE